MLEDRQEKEHLIGQKSSGKTRTGKTNQRKPKRLKESTQKTPGTESSPEELMDIWSLREIFRKRLCRSKRYTLETCEDIAQEMVTQGLEKQRTRGIPVQKMTFKWLFYDARVRVLGNWRWIGVGYCEYQKNPFFPVMSVEDFDTWICANWLSFSNRNNGNGRALARYRIEANGITLEFDARDLATLLRGNATGTDANVIYNFLRKGRELWLLDGRLFMSLSYAKKELGLKPHEKCPGQPLYVTGYRIPDNPDVVGRASEKINAL
jgi:hypothetical protein